MQEVGSTARSRASEPPRPRANSCGAGKKNHKSPDPGQGPPLQALRGTFAWLFEDQKDSMPKTLDAE